jgi:hypothetical protein
MAHDPSSVVASASQPPLTASVVLVPRPLTARAMALRRPEVMIYRQVEYAEEGDILFGQQQEETLKGTLWGPSVELCCPTAVSKAFVGEIFRAGIFFRNSASYALTKLQVRVELFSPSGTRTVLSEGLRAKELSPYGHQDMKIESRLKEPGQYRLLLTASAQDITTERKPLQLNFNIPVEVAFDAIDCRVMFIPRELKSSPGIQHHPVVSFTLQNRTVEPLTLTDVRFEAINSGAYMLALPGKEVAGSSTVLHEPGVFRTRYTGGGSSDPPEDLHIRPGEKRTYLFELQPKTDAGKTAGPNGAAGGNAPGLGRTPSMNSALSDLGTIIWEWRRGNGDGGADRSTMIKASRPPPESEVSLTVKVLGAGEGNSATQSAATPPAAASSAHPPGPSSRSINAGPPNKVFVFEECQVQLKMINQNDIRKRDLMLVIRPEALLAAHWHYSGPCIRLLGIAEAGGGDLEAVIPLVPLRPGVLKIPGEGFQLRDATTPDVVLWPLATLARTHSAFSLSPGSPERDPLGVASSPPPAPGASGSPTSSATPGFSSTIGFSPSYSAGNAGIAPLCEVFVV